MKFYILLAFCLISASFAMKIDTTGALYSKNLQKSDIKPGKQTFVMSKSGWAIAHPAHPPPEKLKKLA